MVDSSKTEFSHRMFLDPENKIALIIERFFMYFAQWEKLDNFPKKSKNVATIFELVII